MRKCIFFLVLIIIVFTQCKKTNTHFFLTEGVYDWEYSYIDNKLITPDSVIKNFSIKVSSSKIKFYENDKLIFRGLIEGVYSDINYSSTCYQGHSYKVDISGSTFYFHHCYLSPNYFYIIGFPYGYYNTNFNNNNLDPNRFYKPYFLGTNKFVKRP